MVADTTSSPLPACARPGPAAPAGCNLEKHARIVDAAGQAFLAAGYAGTSMDAVARRAGVSKQTIYHHFGSKKELFRAIVRRKTDEVRGALDRARLAGGSVRQALARFAETVVEVALAPDTIALYRLLVAESPRQPALGRFAFDAGAGEAIAALAAYLEDASRAGHLRLADSRAAAAQFYGAVVWLPQTEALLSAHGASDRRAAADAAEAAVQAFLRAYSADRPDEDDDAG